MSPVFVGHGERARACDAHDAAHDASPPSTQTDGLAACHPPRPPCLAQPVALDATSDAGVLSFVQRGNDQDRRRENCMRTCGIVRAQGTIYRFLERPFLAFAPWLTLTVDDTWRRIGSSSLRSTTPSPKALHARTPNPNKTPWLRWVSCGSRISIKYRMTP